jgi:hypothetical protein
MRYSPALAESAYDAAVNTAATERRAYDDTYYTATREARWQQMRAGGRPATYDAIYGPGAYAQNYKLSSFGYYAP